MPGSIPREFIDELLTRVDIVDVIDGRVPLTRAGREHKARCPFHEEHTPSFTVSQDKQFYHCFGCGAHGSAIGFLMDYAHMEFREAVEELAAQVGLSIPQTRSSASTLQSAGPDLLTTLQDADRYFRSQLRKHPQASTAIEYLKSRGLTGEIAAQFGIGFAPSGWDNLLGALGKEQQKCRALLQAGLLVRKDNGKYYDRFRERIMFPIHDYRGRVVGFGGRAFGEAEPKYLNSPETALFHKGHELYGLHRSRGAIKSEQKTLVVEGYMDVIGLAQFGVNNAVATLGTATTRAHLERLFRYAPEIVFCFDGDRAGRAAAWRALQNALPSLRDGRQVAFLFLPEGQDPDSLVREEGAGAFVNRIHTARSFADFMFQTLCEKVDLERLDGRARLVELARPLLTTVPTGVLRELLLDQLAQLSQSKRGALGELLANPTDTSTRQHRPQRPTKAYPGTIRKSAIRDAVQLLLHHPRLASLTGDTLFLQQVRLPGVELLAALLDQLKDSPNLSTGAVLERFRETEHYPHLQTLATREHFVDEKDLENEYLGLINAVKRQQYNPLVAEFEVKNPAPSEMSEEQKQRVREAYSPPIN